MKIIIKTQAGLVKKEYVQFHETDTINKLKQQFQIEFRTSVHRQRFTFIKPGTDPTNKNNKVALTDGTKTFKDYNLIVLNGNHPDIELIYKDLGPQVSWRTVFLVEYFGPILIHSVCFLVPSLFYPGHGLSTRKSLTQKLAFVMTLTHYAKREFETLLVHRFSVSTMPMMNIVKNSLHYWILGGIFISYFLYHPQYTPPFEDQPTIMFGISAAWAACQLLNLDAHIRLKNLRPPGTTKRGIPKGQLFELVSCANYFWEICGWSLFCLLTSTVTGWLFCGVGAVQMYFWAAKKHQRYRKEFKDYPKNRTALIPFIL